MYHKFGRRPIMLLSLVCYCAGLIGASQATSYSGLMAARIIHAIGSGVCEALPVQLVNDIFFLHERGQRIGFYTIALCFGSSGPMFAGYMLNGGNSWRLFFYVEFAFGVALLILAFFVVEETMYHRKVPADIPVGCESTDKTSSPRAGSVMTSSSNLPPRKTFLQTLKFWGVWERDSDFFLMMARSFTYFLVPHVLFNYITPIKITAPPYNWSELNSGLISVATIIGYVTAIPFTTSSDRLAAFLTKKNDMIREAEMRLGVCLPAMLIAPAGLIVFGFTAERNLHWIGYFAGVVLCNWSSFFYFTFTLAYALDSYTANTSEMLIAMNLGKQAISFGMGLNLLEWVETNGYAVMIAGVFGSVLLVNNLALIPFMLYGKRMRVFMAKTWLARIHADSAGQVMAA